MNKVKFLEASIIVTEITIAIVGVIKGEFLVSVMAISIIILMLREQK